MLRASQWQGVWAVLVTPFDERLEVDTIGLENQVEFCIEGGADGIVAPVVASEFFTLSDSEREVVFETVSRQSRGRIPFVAGVSGVSSAHATIMARAAERHGASAVLAMPPYIGRGRTDASIAIHYYKSIAAEVSVPIVLQNASSPIGAPMRPEVMTEVCRAVEAIKVIKEETSPNPQRIGDAIASAAPQIEGVFGGLGGIYLLNELSRGAVGTMPACQFVDVVVKIVDLYAKGKLDEARECFSDYLPAVVMERLYGVAFMKECLVRREVIATANTRSGDMSLDSHDLQELDYIWKALEPHMVAARGAQNVTS